jgi:hypothetical protein
MVTTDSNERGAARSSANVYRKLGIRHRWQLIADLDPDRLGDESSQ